ncbi:MAG: glycosyltransferase [Alphaproteobacteria bacterium]
MNDSLTDSHPAPSKQAGIRDDSPRAARVLVVVPLLAVGGAEKHIATVYPRLRASGFDIRIVTARPQAVLDQGLRDAGVPVFNTHAWRPSPLRQLAACINIGRQIRSWRPDIVHFFLPEAYILGGLTAWLLRHPRLTMSRRSLNNYQFGRPWVARLEKFLHRRMTALVANSDAVRHELSAEGVPDTRLHVIRNGVPDEMFDPIPKAQARAKLDLSDEALVMTCVANLIPYKGHADLIDALALCADAMPDDWRLLLAGRDDGIGTTLEAQATQAGIASHIRFLGGQANIADVLASSDLGLLCSHQEGSPNSVLESMAAGLPMVVTDAGGTAEAVADGVTGLVAPMNDSSAIATAIRTLVRDPARRAAMGQAGQARARELHSLEACTNAYTRLYEMLLEAKGHAS